jgi:hypothetical protein
MFDLPPLDGDDALLNGLGALRGLCDGGETGSDSTMKAAASPLDERNHQEAARPGDGPFRVSSQ